MIILYDYLSTQPYGTVASHGGGAYGKYLLRRIIERVAKSTEQVTLLILADLGTAGKELGFSSEFPFVELIDRTDYQDLTSILRTREVNVFYSPVPYYLSDFPELMSMSGLKVRGTIHGLRKLETVWDSYLPLYLRGALRKIKAYSRLFLFYLHLNRRRNSFSRLFSILRGGILVQSEHTRSLLLTSFPNVEPERVFVGYVVPHTDIVVEPNTINETLQKYDLKQRYFVCVNSDRFEKNALRVVDAISRFKIRDSECQFVFLGASSTWRRTALKRLNPTIKDRVRFVEYVSETDYQILLSKAFALIYPSLSEGFGYPPFEAGVYGTPSIVSGTTALPEVFGDSVLYANPQSVQEIATRVNELILNEKLRNELIVKIGERLKYLRAKAEHDEQMILDYILAQ